MTLNWHGGEAELVIKGEAGKRIRAAAIWFSARLKEKMSRGQSTRIPKHRKGYRGHLGKIGLDPSKPGEYPKVVYKNEVKSITYNFDDKSATAQVGTSMKGYPGIQELRANTNQRRPWLSNGVRDFLGGIRKILATGRP